MAVDVIPSRLLWSRLESRAPALDACRLDPAQGGLGDVPAAAPSSGCRLRSARARISFTHLVELVPYSCASALRGGLDSGGVRRRRGRIARTPTRLSGSLAAPIPAPRSAHRGRCPMRKTCATCGGAGVVYESGSRRVPDQSAGVAARVRRQVTTVSRLHGAVARPSQRRGDCAHQRRMDRADDGRPAQGSWMIATGDNDAVMRARVLRTDRGGPGAAR